MKRLTLHIGSHKTGTTSVQMTFARNAAWLRDHGLGYVQGDPLPNLHQYLAQVDPGALIPGGYRVVDPGKLVAALAAARADHVFASSENFSFFFTQRAIDDLASALRPHFSDIRIIAYLRRQDRHAISHHQEGAKPDRRPEAQLWGHALTPLPKPSPQQRLYLDYDQRIGMWEKAFGAGNLQVRVFDRGQLKDGDIVPDILGQMGVPDTGFERLPDINVSLDSIRAKIGHLANEIIGNDRVTAALLAALPPSHQRMLPSVAEARAFLEPYREGNRRLNARLKINDQPELFPEDLSDYPETAAQIWNEASAEETLRLVIRTLGHGLPVRQHLSADDLRMAAQSLRRDQPKAALRLINAAHELRPAGPMILKIRAELAEEVRLLLEKEAAANAT